jgi:hypothetical protein
MTFRLHQIIHMRKLVGLEWAIGSAISASVNWRKQKIIDLVTQCDGNVRVEQGALVAPKILEPLRRQLGVSNGVLDILVPEISLQRPCVVPFIRERVSAGVTEHVRVRL